MPMRLGVLAYPAFLIAIQLTKPSAVPAFEKAQAYSIETSRRPESLEIPRKAVRKAVEKKLLVPVGDGRYYLDQATVRKADQRSLMLMAAATVAFLPLLWLMFFR